MVSRIQLVTHLRKDESFEREASLKVGWFLEREEIPAWEISPPLDGASAGLIRVGVYRPAGYKPKAKQTAANLFNIARIALEDDRPLEMALLATCESPK